MHPPLCYHAAGLLQATSHALPALTRNEPSSVYDQVDVERGTGKEHHLVATGHFHRKTVASTGVPAALDENGEGGEV